MEVAKILSVTLSGAGAPLAKLYLIPKSFSGPTGGYLVSPEVNIGWRFRSLLTTGVVTSSQEDTTSSLSHADQVASSRGTHDAILADQQLLDAIGGTDLGDLGNDLRVVVTAIATNDEERVLDTLGDGQENAGDEGLGVMSLLKDLDLLAEAGAGERVRWDNGGVADNLRSRLLVGERGDGDRLDGHDELQDERKRGIVQGGEKERKRERGKFTDL